MKKGPIYVCSACDAQFPKWAGRCTSCGAWGSVGEEVQSEKSKAKSNEADARPVATSSFAGDEAVAHAEVRPVGVAAIDETLGGGLVAGSVTLIAGEPGIGKSTLIAHVGLSIAGSGGRVIYVTGEESPSQVKRRIERLSSPIPEPFHFLAEDDASVIAATLMDAKPALVIVDSIQCLRVNETTGEAGSVSQVKAAAATLTAAAKRSNVPVILVGQVTKDGDVAGPRVLEHVVDTVLFLEGDPLHRYRLLRALKHRFGSADEVALLEMTERGLELAQDVSSELLRDRASGISGSAVTCLLEGRRPLVLEIQALVSPTGYGTPARRSTGIDAGRLGMLLAVLARRARVNATEKDVYANAAGGIAAKDPSVDLAVAVAVASALKDIPLDPRLAVFGEIGLGGEIRPVGAPGLRLKELARLGFTSAIVPKGQAGDAPKGMETMEAGTLKEALIKYNLSS